MKKRGFTLVELLVVIAIIAMLLAILMPALGKVRQLAYRMMCGTNLKGLGSAIMVYSNDYAESYPRSGGTSSTLKWSGKVAGGSWAWNANEATTTITWASTTDATITSAMFLLIKYSDVSPAQFVCQASNQKKYEFNSTTAGNSQTDITGLWDFGDSTSTTANPTMFVSYCMENPFVGFPISPSSTSGKAIMSDRSPWIDDTGVYKAPVTVASTVTTAPQLLAKIWKDATAENKKGASSQAHQQEGQNVLFNDSHVSFEKAVTCGVGEDNIYTYWTTITNPTDLNKQGGKNVAATSSVQVRNPTTDKAQTEEDSLLVL